MWENIKLKLTRKPGLFHLLKINGQEDLICSKWIKDFMNA